MIPGCRLIGFGIIPEVARRNQYFEVRTSVAILLTFEPVKAQKVGMGYKDGRRASRMFLASLPSAMPLFRRWRLRLDDFPLSK